ncbi:helix-turn-helix transcriptional regulator [Streptacidiphilus fuscans]|uniref:AAA family ATPase n=1 Tax=Streptacidiphilus fuscans TaxID=2789292 RepID=A0A931FAS7_9ACTN|nr:LuxR family transcriptional regulator [Streptacidiphilus fuscans]MBF9066708.1 AAA family ATPase [Streptacidiphilus fuscans]
METTWGAPGSSRGATAPAADAGAPAGPVGRDTELERLRSAVRQEPGAPSALVLLGAEGIGKTRLLDAAGAYAAGTGRLVLSARGWSAERQQTFGCLGHLLAPVTDRVEALADPHRDVLRAVLGHRTDAPAPSAAAVRSSASALLDRIAAPDGLGRTAGVVATVDDAHVCDRATLELLGSLTRGAGGRLSVLLASRDGALLADLPTDVELLHVMPLSLRGSAELLDRLPGAPSGRGRLELVDQAHGNPGALVELCRLHAGAADPAVTLGGPPRLRHLGGTFEAALRQLPQETRRALAHAALALPGDDGAAVMASLGTADLAVWAPAEEAGIVALIDGRVVFRHPMAQVAAAVTESAVVRHQAHRALAELAAERPLDRALHLAAAALGPEPTVARALLEAARTSADDFTAARALEDAARLSTSPQDRAACLARSLSSALAVGDPDWVRELHTRFGGLDADPRLRHEAALAAAEALSLTGRQREAFGLLERTAEQCPPQDAHAAAELAAAAAAVAEQSALVEHRDRLARLVARAEQARVADAAASGAAAPDPLIAFARAVSHGPCAARRSLRRLDVARLGDPLAEPARLAEWVASASVAHLADEPELCLEQLRVADLLFSSRRAFGRRARYLAPLLDTLLATGRWVEADALLNEAEDKATLLRLPRLLADLTAFRTALRALRGQADSVTPPARQLPWIDLPENAATRARLVRADALVALAQGDWADAFRRLRTLFDEDGAPLHPFHSPRCIADLALAGLRAGQVEEAARILDRVRDAQGERPTTRMTLLMHHAAALVDPGTDAEHHFRLALVNAAGERWPLERAQARLSYAIWLRRARRPSEARQQLAAALELVEPLDAACVATWIRQELRASGVAPSAAPGTAPTGAALAELTVQQQQIVRMAAEGLSNREIAEQLFLSPRTVGTHLYNVFPKLGVTRRHQLRDLLQGC